MIFQQLAFAAVLVLMITSLALLVTQDWRRTVLALAIQYLAVFILVSLVWPVGLAAVKLVIGWMVSSLLGASQPQEALIDEGAAALSGRIFRALAGGIIWMLVFSIAPFATSWLPVNMPVIWGGLILAGMGLLQLGMTTRPLRVIIGLLTLLAGFEVLYAAVEASVLVSGLLALVNLGLAVIGSYWMIGAQMEVEE